MPTQGAMPQQGVGAFWVPLSCDGPLGMSQFGIGPQVPAPAMGGMGGMPGMGGSWPQGCIQAFRRLRLRVSCRMYGGSSYAPMGTNVGQAWT